MKISLFAAAAGLLLAPLGAAAQTAAGSAAPPNVFLDCQMGGPFGGCDSSHYRNEIRFVNWVRDRTAADVHLLLTSQGTGGGGQQYTLALMGRGRFAGDSTEVHVSTGQTSTSAERRDELTNRMAQSLLRYAVNTSAANRVRIEVVDAPATEETPEVEIDDPWNFWVFSTRLNTNLNGESREQERQFEMSLSADRVTELWKFDFDFQGSYRHNEFKLSDRTLTSTRRDYGGSTQLVRAIAPLWSAGVNLEAGTSSFSNQDLFVRLATVLEYSFFPYADFSRRQLTLQYTLGARHFDYEEETVYDQLSEQRMDQRLALSLNLRQPWGSARFNLSGSHYLHDIGKNNLSTSGNFNVRLTGGLSLDVSGSYSRVRDQIYIPKGDATDDEVLLRRRALETGYRYRTSVGLRYTFGSVFNNVVNPRIN